MKYYICLLSIALTAIFGMGSVFACGEKGCEKGFYVEGLANAAIPMDEDLDTAAYFGGRAGYQINSLVALELESGFASFEAGNNLGSVDIIPLLANVKLFPFKADRCTLYVLGGLGVIFNDIEVDNQQLKRVFEREADVDLDAIGGSISISDIDTDPALGGQVGLGLSYRFNPRILGFIEARTLFAESDFSAKVSASARGRSMSDTIDDEQELNAVFLGGGVRIDI